MADHMTFAVAPPASVVLPIADAATMFPVNRIFCVGRNYAAHSREMGHDPDRESPFFFSKFAACLVTDGTFRCPHGDVHHEIELAVALAAGGRNIPAASAPDHIFGYAVALDMTRRDLQAELKRTGRPWEIAKAFDGSAPCSPLHPVSAIGHPTRGAITLDVNGTRRQSGDLAQMIWPVPDLIACLSQHFTLQAGDLIFTGTPEGVGTVKPGDSLVGAIAGVGNLCVAVS